MSLENAVCFSNINQPESWKIQTYMSSGGYLTWKKILQGQPGNETRKKIIETIKQSGLRGRGGAGFPTGLKWSFMPKNDNQKYIVCNSDESEPGTCHDREILKLNPHALIEGIAISGFAMNATVGYNYVRGEFIEDCFPRIESALTEAYAHGILGENILDSGVNFDLYNFLGAGAYICGEETGLIESLEGKQGKPRFKPPFPATFGLYGQPTTVNNTQTLASVPKILEKGHEWYASMGSEKSPGTVIFSVSGHVNNPGNFELPLAIPFDVLLDKAGGVIEGKKLKAVIPGGSSTKILKADVISKCTMDYESLQDAGSALGTGAVVVIAEGTCMVNLLKRISRFYYAENCGQCSPCREGTGWLYKILHRITQGQSSLNDLSLLVDIAGKIEGTTICAFGDASAWPVQSFIENYYEEFEYMVKNHGKSIAA
jgi:NADH-quinone oxidoreductase subunit F